MVVVGVVEAHWPVMVLVVVAVAKAEAEETALAADEDFEAPWPAMVLVAPVLVPNPAEGPVAVVQMAVVIPVAVSEVHAAPTWSEAGAESAGPLRCFLHLDLHTIRCCCHCHLQLATGKPVAVVQVAVAAPPAVAQVVVEIPVAVSGVHAAPTEPDAGPESAVHPCLLHLDLHSIRCRCRCHLLLAAGKPIAAVQVTVAAPPAVMQVALVIPESVSHGHVAPIESETVSMVVGMESDRARNLMHRRLLHLDLYSIRCCFRYHL